jgi:hypothetical protein
VAESGQGRFRRDDTRKDAGEQAPDRDDVVAEPVRDERRQRGGQDQQQGRLLDAHAGGLKTGLPRAIPRTAISWTAIS